MSAHRFTGLLVLALAFAAPLVAATSASAWVPRVELRAGQAIQRGGLVWEEWTVKSGRRSCVAASGDGPGEYPEALPVSEEGATRFVLHRSKKPREVSITAFRAVGPGGAPIGVGEELSYELRPRRRADGTIGAWRAVFPAVPPPDYYLDLYAKWPGGVCGGARHLLRRYHLTAAP